MHGSAFPAPSPRTVRRRLAVLALLVAVGPGCTRQAFRERADRDVTGLLTQKNVFPDWAIQNWHVYPDPRARFADPSRPDRPPYPPDDFAARALSPNPQHPTKKSGAGRFEGSGYLSFLAQWDAENRATDPPQAGGDPDPKKADPFPKDFKGDSPPPEKLPPPKPIEPKAAPPLGQARPGIPGMTSGAAPQAQAPARLRPPTVTESRDAGVIVVAGEVQDGDKVVPAVMMIPTAQPEKLPDPPAKADPGPTGKKPEPGPFPPGPGTPPGGPGEPGATGPYAVVATGDAANDFLRALTGNETGYRIRMDQAVELGLFNSREFQDRREDLYLAALPVTLERFNFAALGFFTESAALDFAGRALGRTPRNGAGFGTEAGFSKLFPTGALLMVRLANQVVIDLSNGRATSAVSNLSLGFAQPFLRGGGYAVTLEPLTQAERNLLYAIRSYARFRKLFYVAITAGGDYTNNPYGLQGLSVNLGRGIGNNLTAPTVGYLPLLLQAAVIANQRRNIESLEQLLRLYQAFREGGQQSDLQVGQVEIQLLNSRNQLLGQNSANTGGGGSGSTSTNGGVRGFLDALDSFKLQLGVPLTVGLDLDQTPLRPVREQLARFEAVYAQVRDVETSARQFDPAAPVAQFRPRWRELLTTAPLVRGTEFARELPNRWAAWERLTADDLAKRLAGLAEERRKLLDRRADRQAKGEAEPEEDTRRLNALNSDIDLGVFERAVRLYESQPWTNARGEARETIQAAAFRDAFNAFFQLVLEGQNERLAGIRRQWPKLPPVVIDGVDLLDAPLDEAYTAGIQAALTHRLDLMNARGQVVDAWRQIKVQANALQGVLDVEYNLESSTPPGGVNPAAFSGSRTSHGLTFNGELPLVRRAERNTYRAALIGYQRQRRTLQAFEDNIANDVRADARELRTIAQLYRVQQRLIELGYSQVDNAQAVLLQPPAPGAQNDAGSAAALTQQVLTAQNALLNAQNNLYTIWVNYLVSRMALYLDLELMQLDERGGWSNESLPGNESPDRPERERLPAPRPAGQPER